MSIRSSVVAAAGLSALLAACTGFDPDAASPREVSYTVATPDGPVTLRYQLDGELADGDVVRLDVTTPLGNRRTVVHDLASDERALYDADGALRLVLVGGAKASQLCRDRACSEGPIALDGTQLGVDQIDGALLMIDVVDGDRPSPATEVDKATCFETGSYSDGECSGTSSVCYGAGGYRIACFVESCFEGATTSYGQACIHF